MTAQKPPQASNSLKKKKTPIFLFFSVLHLFHPRLQWLDSHFLPLLNATDCTIPSCERKQGIPQPDEIPQTE